MPAYDEFMCPDKSILCLAAQITLKGANRGQKHDFDMKKNDFKLLSVIWVKAGCLSAFGSSAKKGAVLRDLT